MRKSHFKALALLSGGLDSILSIKIIQEQNIEVEGIIFQSPFFLHESIDIIEQKLNINIHKIDITDELLKIMEHPQYGFGKNLNPCIDCHLLMIKRAGDLLPSLHADFLITGEVLGERPKSQSYNALHLIAKASGYASVLVRPLSAKKLKITEVEKKGIVDRNRLEDITGRSRQRQIELAKKFNIDYYPQPAGGCLLTVPRFADRLRSTLSLKKINKLDLELLKVGRHFITPDKKKIIVSRNEEENKKILNNINENYYVFELWNQPGPLCVFCYEEITESDIMICASLTVRYSKWRDEKNIQIKYYQKGQACKFITTSAKEAKEFNLELL